MSERASVRANNVMRIQCAWFKVDFTQSFSKFYLKVSVFFYHLRLCLIFEVI